MGDKYTENCNSESEIDVAEKSENENVLSLSLFQLPTNISRSVRVLIRFPMPHDSPVLIEEPRRDAPFLIHLAHPIRLLF